MVTIVCADGNSANKGLNGLNGVSPPKSLKPPVYEINGIKILNIVNAGYGSTKWAGRSWTYQELLFSNRRLVFTGSKLYNSSRACWKCTQCVWEEDREDWNQNCSFSRDITQLQRMLRHRIPDPDGFKPRKPSVGGVKLIINRAGGNCPWVHFK